MSRSQGKLIVISGPSGAGKTTLLDRVLAEDDDCLTLSISATTRKPRGDEVDGRNYHFISPEEFQRRRLAGEFLECAEVYPGCWYGTLKTTVTTSLAEGKSVVLEIDVQGMQSVVEQFPEAVTIFVLPGSPAELEASLQELKLRLLERGTETKEAIACRLAAARRELAAAPTFRHQVINDDLNRAIREIQDILSMNRE